MSGTIRIDEGEDYIAKFQRWQSKKWYKRIGLVQWLLIIIFVVVVVGGMGSLSGAFLASVLIGVIQTFAVAIDYSFLVLAKDMGWALSAATQENTFAKLTVSQVAPILPYLFLVLILIFRPKGLLGTREG